MDSRYFEKLLPTCITDDLDCGLLTDIKEYLDLFSYFPLRGLTD